MSMLTVNNLSAGYGNREVLKDISFSLETPGITGILGSNGCGKTTLIKAICGVIPFTGFCACNDVDVSSMSARRISEVISYVPQKSGITIDISVLDVVLMGFNPKLSLLASPDASMRAKASEMLARVGLSGLDNRNFMELSEGQKQLCILARALVSEASVMLLDEPENALDINHRHMIMSLVRSWCDERGGIALCALHDPSIALNCCDSLIVLKDGLVSGCISPQLDDIATIEATLSQIYGDITICECYDKNKRKHLVMLKENCYETND